MAPFPFTFTLQFQGACVHVPLLERVSDALLNQLGCPAAAVAEWRAVLERAMAGAGATGDSRCEVRFHAHDRHVDIRVSADGGEVWQATCALP